MTSALPREKTRPAAVAHQAANALIAAAPITTQSGGTTSSGATAVKEKALAQKHDQNATHAEHVRTRSLRRHREMAMPDQTVSLSLRRVLQARDAAMSRAWALDGVLSPALRASYRSAAGPP